MFHQSAFPVSNTKEELSFEEAVKNLENIIENLESGDIDLAELIDQYENGSKLLKTCKQRLEEAELKIELLRKKSGQPQLENFDPDE